MIKSHHFIKIDKSFNGVLADEEGKSFDEVLSNKPTPLLMLIDKLNAALALLEIEIKESVSVFIEQPRLHHSVNYLVHLKMLLEIAHISADLPLRRHYYLLCI